MNESKWWQDLPTLLLLVVAIVLAVMNLILFPKLKEQEKSLRTSQKTLSELESALAENEAAREQINVIQKETLESHRQVSKYIESLSRYNNLPGQSVFSSGQQAGYFCRYGHDPYEVNLWIPPEKKLVVIASVFRQDQPEVTDDSVPIESKEIILTGDRWHVFAHKLEKNESGGRFIKLLHNKGTVFEFEMDNEEFSTGVSNSFGTAAGPIWEDSIWPENVRPPRRVHLDSNLWTVGEMVGEDKISYTLILLRYKKLDDSTKNK